MQEYKVNEIRLTESALREELLLEIQKMDAMRLKSIAASVYGFELNIIHSDSGKHFIANGIQSRVSSKLDLYRTNVNVQSEAISLLKALNKEASYSHSSFKAKARMLLIKNRLILTEKELNKAIELVKGAVDDFRLCMVEV